MKKLTRAAVLLLCLLAVSGCTDEDEKETEEQPKETEEQFEEQKPETEEQQTETEEPIPETEEQLTETAKPVIYLYPEMTTDVVVTLDYDGDLTCTYPAYGDGWQVTAEPDGTLTTADGRTYSYLFWEGYTDAVYDFSAGFVVSGEETAAFLEEKLSILGLTPREANEFIVYWLPRMQENPYNLIAFQQEAYTEHAQLTVTPEPDTVLRVFMAYQPLDEEIIVPEQVLDPTERVGFTVVEWGGTEVG